MDCLVPAVSLRPLRRILTGRSSLYPEFDVARKMIRRFEIEYDLSALTLESVALATSRELYDNAETGNIHTGEMRIAYEWYVTFELKLCDTNRSADPI